MSKDKAAQSGVEEFEPIFRVHLRGDGVKAPSHITMLTLDDSTDAMLRHRAASGGGLKVAKSISWHAVGVKAVLLDDTTLIVPYAQVDTIIPVKK